MDASTVWQLASAAGGGFVAGAGFGWLVGLNTKITTEKIECETIKTLNETQGGRGRSTKIIATLRGAKRVSINCPFIEHKQCSIGDHKRCRFL